MNVKEILPIIGIIILIYILTTLNFGEITDVFSTIRPLYVFLCLFTVFPIVFLANFQWHLILKKHNIKVGYWDSFKDIFIGFFYGFITPGGLGGYTRAYYLRDQSGETLQKCFVNVLMVNGVDFISLSFLAVVGGFFLGSQFQNLFLIFLSILIIAVILAIVLMRKQTGTSFLKKLMGFRFFNPFKDRLDAQIDLLYEDLPTFRSLVFPLVVSIGGWVLLSFEFYLVSLLFGFNVIFVYFVLIIPVVSFIASIPITVYGLGTREVAMIAMFSVFGVSSTNIVSLSLFWFVVFWVVPSVIGAGFAVLEDKNKKVVTNTKS